MSNNNTKVPSQIFRWFERMKSNYESNIKAVLDRFEQYNHSQQKRIEQANKDHIDSLVDNHRKQTNQYQEQISQYQKDIDYFKQQIASQHQTIEQLNTRYDAVMACLLKEQSNKIDIKDIFESEDFFKPNNTPLPPESEFNPIEESLSQEQTSAEVIFEQAIKFREDQQPEAAVELFLRAANLEHARAMGALGRSYFLGEGVEEDHVVGLNWLIKAAELKLPQAIERVEHFKKTQPELYQLALANN